MIFSIQKKMIFSMDKICM